VGLDLSDSLDRHSMIYAFIKALWRRRPSKGLLVHSDRGVQYACIDFRNLLAVNSCVQSMSPGKRRLREGNYNRRRRHSASGYKSPADIEMVAEQLQSIA